MKLHTTMLTVTAMILALALCGCNADGARPPAGGQVSPVEAARDAAAASPNEPAQSGASTPTNDYVAPSSCTYDDAAIDVDLTKMSADEQIEEVQKGYNAITEVLGQEPSHVMRAPGGNFHDDIIDTLWPYVDAEIGWDVDTEDWSKPGVDKIEEAILSVQPGQVVLMHDGGGEREQTVEALRAAMPILVERGYTVVTIDELLQM
jgi:hypothetical protein